MLFFDVQDYEIYPIFLQKFFRESLNKQISKNLVKKNDVFK